MTSQQKSNEALNWAEEKERLAGLGMEERRKGYHCGSQFTPLEDVPTWKKYFAERQKYLTEKVSEKDRKHFDEDEELNKASSSSGRHAGAGTEAEKVSIFVGDITKLEVDAIVNAANESLLGGGGVDGAIHKASGKLLLAECSTLNGCQTGSAKITSGYKLPAKSIIHTVGPIGEKPDLLTSCYQSSLALMVKHNLRSIAFPCISTGIYGYPSHKAAPVALKAVRTFLDQNPDKVDRVVFCLFLDKDVDIYEKQMQLFFPCGS